MAEAKPIDYQKEAWYTMKNQNYMMRSGFESIKQIIDRAGKPEIELIEDVRKIAAMYVPDRNDA